MSNRVKMILILTLFAVISGGVLSVVYLFSNPLIEANMLAERNKAIFNVVPGAESYQEKVKDDVTYFLCTDGSGSVVGIALPAQGNGYQGVIKLMIGLTPDLSEITGISILEQAQSLFCVFA